MGEKNILDIIFGGKSVPDTIDDNAEWIDKIKVDPSVIDPNSPTFRKEKTNYLFDNYFRQDKLNEFTRVLEGYQKDPSKFSEEDVSELKAYSSMYDDFISKRKESLAESREDNINLWQGIINTLGRGVATPLKAVPAKMVHEFFAGGEQDVTETGLNLTNLVQGIVPGANDLAEKMELNKQIAQDFYAKLPEDEKVEWARTLGSITASTLPQAAGIAFGVLPVTATFMALRMAGVGRQMYEEYTEDQGFEKKAHEEIPIAIGFGLLGYASEYLGGKYIEKLGNKTALGIAEKIGKEALKRSAVKRAIPTAVRMGAASLAEGTEESIEEYGDNFMLQIINPMLRDRGFMEFLGDTWEASDIGTSFVGGAVGGAQLFPAASFRQSRVHQKRLKEATPTDEAQSLPVPATTPISNEPEEIIRSGYLRFGGDPTVLDQTTGTPDYLLESIVANENIPEGQDPVEHFVNKGDATQSDLDKQYYYEVADQLKKQTLRDNVETELGRIPNRETIASQAQETGTLVVPPLDSRLLENQFNRDLDEGRKGIVQKLQENELNEEALGALTDKNINDAFENASKVRKAAEKAVADALKYNASQEEKNELAQMLDEAGFPDLVNEVLGGESYRQQAYRKVAEDAGLYVEKFTPDTKGGFTAKVLNPDQAKERLVREIAEKVFDAPPFDAGEGFSDDIYEAVNDLLNRGDFNYLIDLVGFDIDPKLAKVALQSETDPRIDPRLSNEMMQDIKERTGTNVSEIPAQLNLIDEAVLQDPEVQLIPTSDLDDISELADTATPQNFIIEPVVFAYSKTNPVPKLISGKETLATARNEGMAFVPVKVVQRGAKFKTTPAKPEDVNLQPIREVKKDAGIQSTERVQTQEETVGQESASIQKEKEKVINEAVVPAATRIKSTTEKEVIVPTTFITKERKLLPDVKERGKTKYRVGEVVQLNFPREYEIPERGIIRSIKRSLDNRPFVELDLYDGKNKIEGSPYSRLFLTNKDGSDVYIIPTDIPYSPLENIGHIPPEEDEEVGTPEGNVNVPLEFTDEDGTTKAGVLVSINPDGNEITLKDSEGNVKTIPTEKVKLDAKLRSRQTGTGRNRFESEVESGDIAGQTAPSAIAVSATKPGLVIHSRGPSVATEQIDRGYKPVLDPEQSRTISLTLARLYGADGVEQGDVFLDASGTGVGKSRMALITANEIAKREGKPVLLVTKDDTIADQIREEAKALAKTLKKTNPEDAARLEKLENIDIIKYKDFKTLLDRRDEYDILKAMADKEKRQGIKLKLTTDKRKKLETFKKKWDLTSKKGYVERGEYIDIYDKQYGGILLDESQTISKPFSDTAKIVNGIIREITGREGKAVMYTASPFETAIGAVDVVAKVYGIKREAAADLLGFPPEAAKEPKRDNKGKLVYGKISVTAFNVDKINQAREDLEKKGAFVSQSFPFWGTVETILVDNPNRDEAQDIEEFHLNDRSVDDLSEPEFRQLYGDIKRWTELQKVDAVFAEIQKQLEANPNRKIVVFAEQHTPPKILGETRKQSFINAIVEKLNKAGISNIQLHGEVNAKTKAENLKKFQNNEVQVAVATFDGAGAGINLDDTSGKAPRTALFASVPESAIQLQQAMGRVSRRSTESPSEVKFFFMPESLVDNAKLNLLKKKSRTLGAGTGEQSVEKTRRGIEQKGNREAVQADVIEGNLQVKGKVSQRGTIEAIRERIYGQDNADLVVPRELLQNAVDAIKAFLGIGQDTEEVEAKWEQKDENTFEIVARDPATDTNFAIQIKRLDNNDWNVTDINLRETLEGQTRKLPHNIIDSPNGNFVLKTELEEVQNIVQDWISDSNATATVTKPIQRFETVWSNTSSGDLILQLNKGKDVPQIIIDGPTRRDDSRIGLWIANDYSVHDSIEEAKTVAEGYAKKHGYLPKKKIKDLKNKASKVNRIKWTEEDTSRYHEWSLTLNDSGNYVSITKNKTESKHISNSDKYKLITRYRDESFYDTLADAKKAAIKYAERENLLIKDIVNSSQKVVLTYDEVNGEITIIDDGIGMTPATLDGAFTTIFDSDKEQGSGGGYGSAKVPIFSNAAEITVETTAKLGENDYVTSIFTDSGEKILTGEEPIDIQVSRYTDEDAEDITTGTFIKIKLSKDSRKASFSDVEEFFQHFVTNSDLPFEVRINHIRSGGEETYSNINNDDSDLQDTPNYSYDYSTQSPDSNTFIRVDVFESTELVEDFNPIPVYILNNGMYQLSDRIGIKKENESANKKKVHPKRIIVKVSTNISPRKEGYPFNLDRSALEGWAKKDYEKEIFNRWRDKNNARDTEKLAKVIDQAPQISPEGENGFPLVVISDADISEMRTFSEKVANSTWAKKLIPFLDRAYELFFIETNKTGAWPTYNKGRFAGITLGTTYAGLNVDLDLVFGQDSRGHITLQNPFGSISRINRYSEQVRGKENSPSFNRMLVFSLLATTVHELAHQLVWDHDANYAGVFTEFHALLSPFMEEIVNDILSTLTQDDWNQLYEHNGDYHKIINKYGVRNILSDISTKYGGEVFQSGSNQENAGESQSDGSRRGKDTSGIEETSAGLADSERIGAESTIRNQIEAQSNIQQASNITPDIIQVIINRVKKKKDDYNVNDLTIGQPPQVQRAIEEFAAAYLTAIQSQPTIQSTDPADQLDYALSAPLPSQRNRRKGALVKDSEGLVKQPNALNGMRRDIFTAVPRKIWLNAQNIKNPHTKKALEQIAEFLGLPPDIRRNVKESFDVNYRKRIRLMNKEKEVILDQAKNTLNKLGYRVLGGKSRQQGYEIIANLVRGDRFKDVTNLSIEEQRLSGIAKKIRDWENKMWDYQVKSGVISESKKIEGYFPRVYDVKQLLNNRAAFVNLVTNKLMGLSKDINPNDAREYAEKIFLKIVEGNFMETDFRFNADTMRRMRDPFEEVAHRLEQQIKAAKVALPSSMKSRALFFVKDSELNEIGVLRNDLDVILNRYLRDTVKFTEFSKIFGRNYEVVANAIETISNDNELSASHKKELVDAVTKGIQGTVGTLGLDNFERFSSHNPKTRRRVRRAFNVARSISAWGVLAKTGITAAVEFGFPVLTTGYTAAIPAYVQAVKDSLFTFFKGDPHGIMEFVSDMALATEMASINAGLNLGSENADMEGMISKLNMGYHKYVSFLAPITAAQRVIATGAVRNRLKSIFKSNFDGLKGENKRIIERWGFGKDEASYNNLKKAFNKYTQHLPLTDEEFDNLHTAFMYGVTETIVETSAANRPAWGSSANPYTQTLYQLNSYTDAVRNGPFAIMFDELKEKNLLMLLRFIPLIILAHISGIGKEAVDEQSLTADQKSRKDLRKREESQFSQVLNVVQRTGVFSNAERAIRPIRSIGQYNQDPAEAIAGVTGANVMDVGGGIIYGLGWGNWEPASYYISRAAPKITPLIDKHQQNMVKQGLDSFFDSVDPRTQQRRVDEIRKYP